MKVGLNHAYLYPFRRSSFLKCALQLKIAKVNKNLLFWKFRVFQIHRCWYDWKARHYNACCDRQYVHAYLQPFSRKTSIQRGGAALWCPRAHCAGFLESRKSKLGPSKSTSSAKNFIRSLSMSISVNFGAISSWNVSRSPKKIH